MNVRPDHVRKVASLVHAVAKLRGGGSALPGLVAEKLDPKFLERTLKDLPQGVVVVSGTNGKTTTTKMVVQLLRAHGLKVFTNPSGSNFTRGIASALLTQVDADGHLDADIAVLELDEAHAVHFIAHVAPRYTLVLNVLRDQLDRFGEIDHTARLLEKVVASTTKGIVLNREDPLVRKLAESVKKSIDVQYFGHSNSLSRLFPSDSDLHGKVARKPLVVHEPSDGVTLEKLSGRKATFAFAGATQDPVTLKLDGAYNVLNAAAALTLVRQILGRKVKDETLLSELATVRPAFGRGEAVDIDGEPLEIVLVKNPSGFRLALHSYASRPAATMIAINDNYADGRDMSWLWDVDFRSLADSGVTMVSGIRAYDMALRLQYDDIELKNVETHIGSALRHFISTTSGPRRIYCTYTAMLTMRRELGKQHHLEPIE
jgi:UDP-N-acetylmuramyl tripeptide synthase